MLLNVGLDAHRTGNPLRDRALHANRLSMVPWGGGEFPVRDVTASRAGHHLASDTDTALVDLGPGR